MELFQILACDSDMLTIIRIVRFALKGICYAVPIILIVLTVIDVAKVVTNGNIDDKVKKEATNKITTRVIYAVLIFLIPTIVSLLFKALPVDTVVIDGSDWKTCWDEADK